MPGRPQRGTPGPLGSSALVWLDWGTVCRCRAGSLDVTFRSLRGRRDRGATPGTHAAGRGPVGEVQRGRGGWHGHRSGDRRQGQPCWRLHPAWRRRQRCAPGIWHIQRHASRARFAHYHLAAWRQWVVNVSRHDRGSAVQIGSPPAERRASGRSSRPRSGRTASLRSRRAQARCPTARPRRVPAAARRPHSKMQRCTSCRSWTGVVRDSAASRSGPGPRRELKARKHARAA